MDCNTLAAFRQNLYACFGQASDALMNMVDALLTDTAARSFVELSLSPVFERRWPSLYKGLQAADIDRNALQALFAASVPVPEAGKRLVVGGDASSIARPQSKTARDRTYVHLSNLPEGSKPITAGWQFSTLSVLPEATSSWTYVLDNQRIPSHKTQGEVMAAQLRQMTPLLPVRALFLGDGYYGSATFLLLSQAIACDKLVRFANNRVLYRPAPPKTGKRGAPRKDGDPFKCRDAQTHGSPDACRSIQDATGQAVDVACWNGLHFKDARHLSVSVLRVTRHGAADTKRDPKVSWFVFAGEAMPALEQIPALYARRYSLEHAYRVDKQDLLWACVRLRTPEQMQHWTDLVACVRNQLFLARQMTQTRQPWESKTRPVTPQQVRRAMGPIIRQLGTPARKCRVRGKSPGRRMGQIVEKAPRFQVVYKATEKAIRKV
jgi:hypothetical protein